MPGLPSANLDSKEQVREARDPGERAFEGPDSIPDAAPHVVFAAASSLAPDLGADAAPVVAGLFVGDCSDEIQENVRFIVNHSPMIQKQIQSACGAHPHLGLDFISTTGQDDGFFDSDLKCIVICEDVMAADPRTSGLGVAVLAHELQHAANAPAVAREVAQALETARRNGGNRDTEFVRDFIDISRRDEARAEIAAWNAFHDFAKHTQPQPLNEAAVVAYGGRCLATYVENRPDGTRGLKPEFTRLMDPEGRIAETPENVEAIGRLFFDPPFAVHGKKSETTDYAHLYAAEAIHKLGVENQSTGTVDFQRLGLNPEIVARGLARKDEDDASVEILDDGASPGLSPTGDGPAVASPATLASAGSPLADPRSSGPSGAPRSFPSGSTAGNTDHAAVAGPLPGLGRGPAGVALENAAAGARDITSQAASRPLWGAWLDPPGMGAHPASSSSDADRARATGIPGTGEHRAAPPDPWALTSITALSSVNFTFPGRGAHGASPVRITNPDNVASGVGAATRQEVRPQVPVVPLSAPAPSYEASRAGDASLVHGGDVRSGKRRVDAGTDAPFDRTKSARSDAAPGGSDAAFAQAASAPEAARRRDYMALYRQCSELLEPHANTMKLDESERVSSAACLALEAAKKGLRQVDWVAPYPKDNKLYAGEGRQGDLAQKWVEADIDQARKTSPTTALAESMTLEPATPRAVAIQSSPGRAL